MSSIFESININFIPIQVETVLMVSRYPKSRDDRYLNLKNYITSKRSTTATKPNPSSLIIPYFILTPQYCVADDGAGDAAAAGVVVADVAAAGVVVAVVVAVGVVVQRPTIFGNLLPMAMLDD